MKGKDKWSRILRDWYKPTRNGEKAREVLGRGLNVDGQIGAVGEDVDEIEDAKDK